MDVLAGVAAGVSYLAPSPRDRLERRAPMVVGWHLGDPPRIEAAPAAALPLTGLRAWRVYFGLPLHGARLPSGGADELMHRGFEDAARKLQKPVTYGAAAGFPNAFAVVCK